MSLSNKYSTALSPKSGNVTMSDGRWINWADFLFNQTDSFGYQIVQNVTNVAGISAEYQHSPERQRLYINGSRFLLQYNTTAKFEDAVDSYILKPAVGDTMRYRTAERFRYIVGNVMSTSAAFETNQALQGNDRIIIGYGDTDIDNNMASANGWFWEYTASGVEINEYRAGTKVVSQSVTLEKSIEVWQRIEDRINWYNVGNREARQTYTKDGVQYNPIVGRTSVDNGKGPTSANFPIEIAIECDTAGLELEVGSFGVKILGDGTPRFRIKESLVTAAHTGSNLWEPLFAIERDPNQPSVFVNISDVAISQISADDDVEILVISVDPSNTDASGFTTPIYHSDKNSAIRETSTITTFPDSDGVPQASASNPGGYQLGYTNYFVAGTGTANRRTTQGQGIRRRALSNGDYAVFLAKTDTAMDISINYETEQEW